MLRPSSQSRPGNFPEETPLGRGIESVLVCVEAKGSKAAEKLFKVVLTQNITGGIPKHVSPHRLMTTLDRCKPFMLQSPGVSARVFARIEAGNLPVKCDNSSDFY